MERPTSIWLGSVASRRDDARQEFEELFMPQVAWTRVVGTRMESPLAHDTEDAGRYRTLATLPQTESLAK